MKLIELTTEGFKVPDRTYSFRCGDRPSDVVLVTGAPGSGKTMFLYLIAGLKEAFAPYGSPPYLRRFLRAGRTTGKLSALFTLSDDEMERAALPSRHPQLVVDVAPSGDVCTAEPALKRLFTPLHGVARQTNWELFPAHRRLETRAFTLAHPPLSAAIERGRRLAPDGDKYTVLRRVLHELVLAQASEMAHALDEHGVALLSDAPDLIAPYKAAVAAMLPDLRLLSVALRPGGAAPLFARRSGERVPIAELSASEEQGVLMAFAFTWLRLEAAVVLIDSPEANLATGQQMPFFERLLALRPGNQIIAATGSTALLSLHGALILDLSTP